MMPFWFWKASSRNWYLRVNTRWKTMILQHVGGILLLLLYGGSHFYPCQVGTHGASCKSALLGYLRWKTSRAPTVGLQTTVLSHANVLAHPSAEEFPARAPSLEIKQLTASVGSMWHNTRRHFEDLIMHLCTMPDKHSTGTQSRLMSWIFFTGADFFHFNWIY